MTRSMLFDGWSDVVRVVVLGALAYTVMVIVLRVSGKRTLAKLNAFDLVITVALGSVLATIALSSDVSLTEGVAAIALLVTAVVLETDGSLSVVTADRYRTASAMPPTTSAFLLDTGGVAPPRNTERETVTSDVLPR